MSNNDFAKHTAAVKHRITTLTSAIRDAKDLDIRHNLEKQLAEFTASIGLEYRSNPDLNAADAVLEATSRVGSVIVKAVEAVTGHPVDLDVKPLDPAIPAPTLSLWARFKNFVSEKKVAILSTIGGLLVIGAGAYYYAVNKNAGTASSVSGISGVEGTETIEGGQASIFSKVGAWVVNAAYAVRDAAVSAWVWVKNLFNKKESTVEVTVDATPAAA